MTPARVLILAALGWVAGFLIGMAAMREPPTFLPHPEPRVSAAVIEQRLL